MNERINQFIRQLGITVSEFERVCNLSNGAVSKIGDNTRTSTLEKISKAYPALNIAWLRTGEGDMTRGSVQISQGENSPNISGNGNVNGSGNNVSVSPTLDMAISEISEQRKLVSKSQEQVSKSQEQIDRLLAIIERMQSV